MIRSAGSYLFHGFSIYVAIFFMLFLGSLSASSPVKLSLEEAQQLAIEHSSEMRTARADLQIAEKQIWETTAAGLPQVNASLGYNYYLDIPTSLVPAEFFGGEAGDFAEIQFGTEHNMTATASVDQLIFDGQYIVGLKAARIYRDLADQNLERSTLEISSTINETYYLALYVTENLQITRQNLAVMEKWLWETEKMLEAGFTDPINVDQLQLAVSNIRNGISSLERQNLLTMNLLKYQMGLDLQTHVELTDDLEELFDQALIELSTPESLNKEQHIDYRLATSQETMSLMILRRQQTAYLPSLSASFIRQEMAMRDAFNFFDSEMFWFPSTYFTVNLNIPIFSSGMRSSQVQQARLELEKSRIAKEQVGQALSLQMEEAVATLNTARDQYMNEKANLELASRILTRTNVMFREGMASSLELTQANDQLLSSRSNYLNAMVEVLNAKNQLEKALGN
jgi:outer membrane protein